MVGFLEPLSLTHVETRSTRRQATGGEDDDKNRQGNACDSQGRGRYL